MRQHLADPLVGHDVALGDALGLVEHVEGQGAALVLHIELAIGMVEDVHASVDKGVRVEPVLADGRVEDEKGAFVVQVEVVSDLARALHAHGRGNVVVRFQRPVQFLRVGGPAGEARVVRLDVARGVSVGGLHIRYALDPHGLDEAVLQHAIGALHAALGLRVVGADQGDAQLIQGAGELRAELTVGLAGDGLAALG